jgi:chemotaxis protein histidine kinase CheA
MTITLHHNLPVRSASPTRSRRTPYTALHHCPKQHEPEPEPEPEGRHEQRWQRQRGASLSYRERDVEGRKHGRRFLPSRRRLFSFSSASLLMLLMLMLLTTATTDATDATNDDDENNNESILHIKLKQKQAAAFEAGKEAATTAVDQQEDREQQQQEQSQHEQEDLLEQLQLLLHEHDGIEDSFYDPFQADPDCLSGNSGDDASCWSPPASTIETETTITETTEMDAPLTPEQQLLVDATCAYGGDDPDEISITNDDIDDDNDAIQQEREQREQQCRATANASASKPKPPELVDKHWGSDPNILRMRNQLRQTGSGESIRFAEQRKAKESKRNENSEQSTNDQNKQKQNEQKQQEDPNQSDSNTNSNSKDNSNPRPPIFLLPGLASTRLVAWKFKACPQHPLLSDIKVQDIVWLNINLIMQMGTIDCSCIQECMQLGWNQSDTDDLATGCKLRPDEGLDAISSLSPAGVGSQLLVGGTNTVYAWLIQWLADNLGYDVGNIVGLPYDWRLSPDKMERRDGFLTLTRRRMEAAVQSNGGKPGIMVAHSMGNIIFRYFLEWLRTELRQEAYDRYLKTASRRARFEQKAAAVLVEETETTVPGATPAAATSAPSSPLPGWLNAEWVWPKWAEGDKNGNNIGDKENHESAEGSSSGSKDHTDKDHKSKDSDHKTKLWELAQMEGDDNWYEWIETHIWTYVGLSAPMLGAVNPLRAVISGENMGVPMADDVARVMEVTFGSTHTVNPISTKEGFCDQWDVDRWDEEPSPTEAGRHADTRLACLDDILNEVEMSADNFKNDPWKNFPALKAIMRDRIDWDSDFPMIGITNEYCEEKEKSPCVKNRTLSLGPKDAQTGNLFTQLSETWKEEGDPLVTKREQLRESFWDPKVKNILNNTWERPLIKHVVMAYGVDIPTEVAYTYTKRNRADGKSEGTYDGLPDIKTVVWEEANGVISEELIGANRGGLTELLTKRKPKRVRIRNGSSEHGGDGSVPYVSLSWAHTWLLHAVRALRHSGKEAPVNPLDSIEISHRPEGATEWKQGPPPERAKKNFDKKFEESRDTGKSPRPDEMNGTPLP